MARRMTAGDICKEALGLQGLPVPQSIATNVTDASARQMWTLLRTTGRRLSKPVRTHRWQALTREWVFDTVPGKTRYDMPSDHDGFIDQTAWNRTIRYPMLGPATDRQWEQLYARVGTQAVGIIYRISGDQFEVQSSPSVAQQLHISYTSRNWVRLSNLDAEGKPVFADAPREDGDTVVLDPEMMVAAVQHAFMTAKGFDTTAITGTLDTLIETAINNDTDAPLLSAVGSEREPMVGEAGVIALGPQDSTFLVSNKPPTPEDGNEGDFWIDNSTNTIYGPKTDGQWKVALDTKALWV